MKADVINIFIYFLILYLIKIQLNPNLISIALTQKNDYNNYDILKVYKIYGYKEGAGRKVLWSVANSGNDISKN